MPSDVHDFMTSTHMKIWSKIFQHCRFNASKQWTKQ